MSGAQLAMAFFILMIIVQVGIGFARAGETCTQYGNRLECRTDDGGYREEYQYGDRTEKNDGWQGDDE